MINDIEFQKWWNAEGEAEFRRLAQILYLKGMTDGVDRAREVMTIKPTPINFKDQAE